MSSCCRVLSLGLTGVGRKRHKTFQTRPPNCTTSPWFCNAIGIRWHASGWHNTAMDTLRTNWEQLSNLFTKYLGGKFWICSECAYHFDHTLITGQILNLISKNPSIYPVGIHSQNPGVSFIICPQHVWATHQKFFQNLLRNLFSFCSTTYTVG